MQKAIHMRCSTRKSFETKWAAFFGIQEKRYERKREKREEVLGGLGGEGMMTLWSIQLLRLR